MGPPGNRGQRGAAGLPQRDAAMETLQDQIRDLYRQLDIQLRRIAQIQQQIDEIAARQKRITGIVG
jgi:F0F1-type ATP synthase gamma subunit